MMQAPLEPPLTMSGPPGTTQSPTDPNTYLPSSLQTQSSIPPPMSPYGTPPPLGAPVAPSMSGFAVADNSGFPDQSSVMGPNVTSPNIMESPFQYAPAFPSVLNDPNAANLMAPPTLGGAPTTTPGSGPPMLNGLGYDPMQLGTANTAGMPTFGNIGHIPMPSNDLGAVPPMSVEALPLAFGYPGASGMPQGGIAIGQYAGGTSMPTSMAEGLSSGGQAYTGSGFNPATLAGTGIGGTDLAAPALGAVGPSGSAGVAPSGGGETSGGGGGGPVGSSGTSHAIAIMQQQAAEHAAKMAAQAAASKAQTMAGLAQSHAAQAQSSSLLGSFLDRQRLMAGAPIFNANSPYYGMNVGFSGPSFGNKF